MQKITFKYASGKKCSDGLACCVGVVGSGSCEVLVDFASNDAITFEIVTSVEGFDSLWKAVCDDFVEQYKPEPLHFTINDGGATPSVVSLRLRQALETFHDKQVHKGTNYLELDARGRIASMFESFDEFNCKEGCYSSHLAELGITGEHDDGIVIGRALFEGKKLFVAAQQKDFIGGSVGEMHGAKLNALFKKAKAEGIEAVVLLIDSGGVRLQEANAGEIAISEIIRSIFEARSSGIKTIGVACGKNGAYGGMGIISAALDCRIVSEVTRMGVSGAEVIQAVNGIEAFNAQDRALVWRVYGGKTRYLQKEAEYFVNNDVDVIKVAIGKSLEDKGELNLEDIKVRQATLNQRFEERGDCNEEGGYLKKILMDNDDVFDMSYADFIKAANHIREGVK